MSTDDYYTILGVSAQASTQEIKEAYRRMALEHPRQPVDQGDERFFMKFFCCLTSRMKIYTVMVEFSHVSTDTPRWSLFA